MMLKAKIILYNLMAGLVFIIITAECVMAQQPAFPSAEGSGRFSTGGRGGDVYEVTTLNNNGPGSIVDAVSSGNRTIVFRISGTIELGDVILRPKSNTTIAGQTAPGDGVCLKGRIHIGEVSDIVIRYIRVRVDSGAANSAGDAIDIDEGTNIIIDHVSASYARDEGISCQETSDRVTVQWCIISEALTAEQHSYGSLIRGDYGDQKSYHHNLYAHNNNRMPRPGNYTNNLTDTLGLYFDFRNNVVYNWKGSQPGYNADTTSISRYNFIGNVYIPGQESSVQNKAFKESAVNAYAFFENNSYNGVVPADQWSLVTFSNFGPTQIAEYKARSYVIPMEEVTTTPPEQAKEDVLAIAGASIPSRDTIDARIVNDVLQGTGRSIKTTAEQPEGGWPLLESLPAPEDDDHDGMPNDWELAHNLNPNDPSVRNNIDDSGYTELEVYLNSISGDIITHLNDASDSFPGRFMLAQNYPNPFNPNTTITFHIARRSPVILSVLDLLGREVEILVKETKEPGTYSVRWQAGNASSGIYFYKLIAGDFIQTRKMVLIH
jgi:pectate lyase